MIRNQPLGPKHVPQRTCIACRQKKAKGELIRIVRTPGGSVEIDPKGKKSGRGAYLCRQQNCWEVGLKKNLEHVLKTQIASENRLQLLEYSKTLLAGAGS